MLLLVFIIIIIPYPAVELLTWLSKHLMLASPLCGSGEDSFMFIFVL